MVVGEKGACARRTSAARAPIFDRTFKAHLDRAELASGLEAEDAKGLGNDHLLLLVEGRGHALEELQALKGGGSTGRLGEQRAVSSRSRTSTTTHDAPCGEPYRGWCGRGCDWERGGGRVPTSWG